MAHSVMDSIFLLFEKVENKHGWLLVIRDSRASFDRSVNFFFTEMKNEFLLTVKKDLKPERKNLQITFSFFTDNSFVQIAIKNQIIKNSTYETHQKLH